MTFFLSFLTVGTFFCFGSFAVAAAAVAVGAAVFSAAARARDEATRLLCGFLVASMSPPWFSVTTAIVLFLFDSVFGLRERNETR